MHDHHDAPFAGHPSWTLTYDLLARNYFWPKMSIDVRKYVRSCDDCQRNKDDQHQPYGLLQPLPVSGRKWESLTMDFITHLPKTDEGYDALTVLLDRLTKMVTLVPGKITDTAQDVAEQFLNNIFRYHGLPAEIITDRDARFISRFWKCLHKLLGVNTLTSTAFHPQTDRQTEYANRTIEQVL